MKKNILRVAFVAFALMCGTQVHAQISLGDVLNNAAQAMSGDKASSTKSAITSIFNSKKVATADKLVGTWSYQEPAIVLSDANVLKNLGGKIASAAIEKKLQNQFNKIGLTKGRMQMTFYKNGNFTQQVGTKKATGTYKVDGQHLVLTYMGVAGQFSCISQIDGKDLLIVMDASKLLKYAKTVGALTGNSTANTLGSILSGYDGLQCGLKLHRIVNKN